MTLIAVRDHVMRGDVFPVRREGFNAARWKWSLEDASAVVVSRRSFVTARAARVSARHWAQGRACSVSWPGAKQGGSGDDSETS